MPTQPNRLEADPLTMLSKFQRQEASQSKIAKVFQPPSPARWSCRSRGNRSGAGS